MRQRAYRVRKCGGIAARQAAITADYGEAFHVFDHGARLPDAHRREPQRDVAVNFGEYPTDAEHDDRADLGVALVADDHLREAFFHRLDEHYEWLGRFEAPDLKQKPSEYLKSNCFLSVEADEERVNQYVEIFGDDNVVFSTDYPHADSKFPRAVRSFFKLPLCATSQRKILWDNWSRLYDIAAPRRVDSGQ